MEGQAAIGIVEQVLEQTLEQRLGLAVACRMLERCFWIETEIEIGVHDASLLVVLEVAEQSEGIHQERCSQLNQKIQV